MLEEALRGVVLLAAGDAFALLAGLRFRVVAVLLLAAVDEEGSALVLAARRATLTTVSVPLNDMIALPLVERPCTGNSPALA